MAITNGYATVAQVKATSPSINAADSIDTVLEMCIE